jgi:hypothetical protein
VSVCKRADEVQSPKVAFVALRSYGGLQRQFKILPQSSHHISLTIRLFRTISLTMSATSSDSEGSDGDIPSQSAAQLRPPKKRGRPEVTSLEPFKEQIIKLFSEDNIPIIDIARRLNLDHGLDISERTISRRLTVWNVPRKKTRIAATDDLRDRIAYHYNKNLNDEQIAAALVAEGFDVKPRNLARLRQKLGMRRRSKYPEFRAESEEDEASAQLAAEAGLSTTKPPLKKRKKAKTKHNAALIPKVTAFVEKYMSMDLTTSIISDELLDWRICFIRKSIRRGHILHCLTKKSRIWIYMSSRSLLYSTMLVIRSICSQAKMQTPWFWQRY